MYVSTVALLGIVAVVKSVVTVTFASCNSSNTSCVVQYASTCLFLIFLTVAPVVIPFGALILIQYADCPSSTVVLAQSLITLTGKIYTPSPANP